MEFEKYYVVANTREQFLNEVLSSRVYNDHPSKKQYRSNSKLFKK